MHFVETKSLLSPKNGINIYRGCTHGCIYCDSRSKCYNMNHEFTDIEIKQNAPELLEQALIKKRNKCMIGTGAMTDPYLHLETQFKLTNKCLKIIDKYHFGLAIQTKSARILEDLELLKSINEHSKCVVEMTLTTYDEELCKKIEPNVSTTKERFEVLKVMRDNNIPTVVWLCPLLPFINDTEDNLRGILKYCIEAKVYGILFFGVGLTLREGNREYFYQQLDKLFPELKNRYIKTYGNNYEITSPNNNYLMKIFYEVCQKNNIETDMNKIFNYMHEYPESHNEQISIFDKL